jgi:hypothetical protein
VRFEKLNYTGGQGMNMQVGIKDGFVRVAAIILVLAVVIEIAAKHIW